MYDKPSLIVLAAGMGSRFGGLKQLTPVGKNGESILDYSVFDALESGFERVVFIIKKAIDKEFREKVGKNIEKYVKVDYVYQEVDSLPEGYSAPAERAKPWGTGHAVWCALEQTGISSFMVINSDDYYGGDCFRRLYSFLSSEPQDGDKIKLAMSGYRLMNTLSENGSVSRGVCVTDENNMLISLTERNRIEKRGNGPAYTENNGEAWIPLDGKSFVSMNCWAFPEKAKPYFGLLLKDFLDRNINESGKEFYLPDIPDRLIQNSIGEVRVYPTEDKWYGITYADDLPSVSQALAKLTAEGRYPQKLWK